MLWHLRASGHPRSALRRSLCRARPAVEPVRFWIYSPALIPETVTPISLPLCSWSLSMHDRMWAMGFMKLHTHCLHAQIHTSVQTRRHAHATQSLQEFVHLYLYGCAICISGFRASTCIQVFFGTVSLPLHGSDPGQVLPRHRALKTPTHENKVCYFWNNPE